MKKLTKNNVRKVLAVALTVIVGVVTMIPDSAIRTNADESDASHRRCYFLDGVHDL